MGFALVPLLFTCCPLFLASSACLSLVRRHKTERPRLSAILATRIVFAIAGYAAFVFLRYSLKSLPYLPPWKDPQTLSLALLFFTAPVGFELTMVAAAQGASKWIVLQLIAASALLFLVGLLECISV